ncbi:hypothetical protein FNH05_07840 [Amycolatopsis rhizosphaerae]|uniref:Sigma 54 modulation/S30EA ribosomal protein C-terminal domain-containing protein n=1 Tax=Amycolatopsis rhizosphaerae TaxID=2053003 RepID=A0A558D750_9PSEU|nr:sigma 54 modulation/S30EA ribosomal C-terminal domain-containing protein [Amycolatopsis rhizosphaerae]TVT56828.1 hypothetical protein FNH05_07840 [Amycolatopsis rhizosphaerae]
MSGTDIAVETSGEILTRAREQVERQIEAFVRRLPGTVEGLRVRLTTFRQNSTPRPALAQINLTLNGRALRAQVAAPFFPEAATLLRARLCQHQARLDDPSTPRPWPDAYRQCHPASLCTVSPARRKIVRRKEFPLQNATPDEAALTMDVRDYDFHLFVDAETGQDSLVYRIGPTGYRLARLSGLQPPQGAALPWTINVHGVPELTPEQAAERLDDTEMPHRFFQDTATGRGSVLYLRYDGHYGLLTAG